MHHAVEQKEKKLQILSTFISPKIMAAEKQNTVHKKTEFYPRESPFWWTELGKTAFYPRKRRFWWIDVLSKTSSTSVNLTLFGQRPE